MREDFSELELPPEAVVAYPPDRDGVFDWVRPQVTDRMLRAIAECDYGEDAKEHLRELKRIRQGIDLNRPIGWVPNEVLALFRWSTFDAEKVLKDPHEFHLARAFSCCALLRIPDEVGNRENFEPDSLLPLIESVPILGEEFRNHLLGFISHDLESMKPWDEPYLFYALGMIGALAEGENDSELLYRIGAWFVAAHEVILPWHSDRSYSETRTFLDLRFASILQNRWQNLAAGLRDKLPADDPLQPLLVLLAKGRTFRQKAEDARDTVQIARLVAPGFLKLLWQVWRKKP